MILCPELQSLSQLWRISSKSLTASNISAPAIGRDKWMQLGRDLRSAATFKSCMGCDLHAVAQCTCVTLPMRLQSGVEGLHLPRTKTGLIVTMSSPCSLAISQAFFSASVCRDTPAVSAARQA